MKKLYPTIGREHTRKEVEEPRAFPCNQLSIRWPTEVLPIRVGVGDSLEEIARSKDQVPACRATRHRVSAVVVARPAPFTTGEYLALRIETTVASLATMIMAPMKRVPDARPCLQELGAVGRLAQIAIHIDVVLP
jgi:hypothetical protein